MDCSCLLALKEAAKIRSVPKGWAPDKTKAGSVPAPAPASRLPAAPSLANEDPHPSSHRSPALPPSFHPVLSPEQSGSTDSEQAAQYEASSVQCMSVQPVLMSPQFSCSIRKRPQAGILSPSPSVHSFTQQATSAPSRPTPRSPAPSSRATLRSSKDPGVAPSGSPAPSLMFRSQSGSRISEESESHEPSVTPFTPPLPAFPAPSSSPLISKALRALIAGASDSAAERRATPQGGSTQRERDADAAGGAAAAARHGRQRQATSTFELTRQPESSSLRRTHEETPGLCRSVLDGLSFLPRVVDAAVDDRRVRQRVASAQQLGRSHTAFPAELIELREGKMRSVEDEGDAQLLPRTRTDTRAVRNQAQGKGANEDGVALLARALTEGARRNSSAVDLLSTAFLTEVLSCQEAMYPGPPPLSPSDKKKESPKMGLPHTEHKQGKEETVGIEAWAGTAGSQVGEVFESLDEMTSRMNWDELLDVDLVGAEAREADAEQPQDLTVGHVTTEPSGPFPLMQEFLLPPGLSRLVAPRMAADASCLPAARLPGSTSSLLRLPKLSELKKVPCATAKWNPASVQEGCGESCGRAAAPHADLDALRAWPRAEGFAPAGSELAARETCQEVACAAEVSKEEIASVLEELNRELRKAASQQATAQQASAVAYRGHPQHASQQAHQQAVQGVPLGGGNGRQKKGTPGERTMQTVQSSAGEGSCAEAPRQVRPGASALDFLISRSQAMNADATLLAAMLASCSSIPESDA